MSSVNREWDRCRCELTRIRETYIYIATYNPLVPHICVSKSGQHWFRQWPVAYSAPSHYVKQCWDIVKLTLRNKLKWNFNQNTKLFIHENASECIVYEMAAILSWGRWVNVVYHKKIPFLVPHIGGMYLPVFLFDIFTFRYYWQVTTWSLVVFLRQMSVETYFLHVTTWIPGDIYIPGCYSLVSNLRQFVRTRTR